MGKIAQLDEWLSNRIAAGEVVERPASVVKELVENAIDAQSTVIEIDVEEAGLQKIHVIDNGTGIEADDVELAFSRHATSKIKNEHDLFRIRSLGFRGEALPSIASVARVEIVTSTGEGPGIKAIIEGGKWLSHETAPSRKGTEMTVTDLFFNTPARLKYMKSIHTELGNITDVVNRLALAHPEVSIRLRHGGKMLLQTNGNGDVRQVLAAIYGVNIAKKMIPIHAETLDFELNGYIALPEITRASRNYISTMVNGRFIKNYPLAKAILEGYHTLLPIGRYPIALLSVRMDPVLVDANVHPAKLEVRLSKEKELCQIISETIKAAFKKQELIPTGMIRAAEKPKQEQVSFRLDHLPEKEGPKNVEAPVKPSFPIYSHKDALLPEQEMKKLYMPNPGQSPETPSPLSKPPEDPVFPETVRETDTAFDYKEAEQTIAVENPAPRVPPMYPIGQMHGTYIFAQNENGLYIIDQHAAQERVKYEYFREKVGEVKKELQDMLVPLTLEYSTDEAIKIQENLDALKEVGVFLEPFGHNSFIVRSHPTWFPKNEEKEVIEEMIEQVLLVKKVDIKKLREEAAIMMSCKGSIKANRHLRNDEIQALLDALRMSSDPFTCPHGRPIIIHYSVYDLEKMFKRVM
ncbi:DNA mismatch repair protein MutL [Weizmannia acidilactici]|uniref:DNA mismatch repair protein MutL n=1 Tax=Weizmannia acidilactici TaxID=2607726 RepID=A0A5J4JIY7_9BACI|nr:DNA mismatch repair endonuclease MutL [Weizmannia acidilactici]GER65706.1 DNA mismatch repair protein MutL [Weizmannia acidilactici]GER68964.1 DNA mismatch repair protein MutL [Weizmannia acidilactici]GER72063.1 DNA mismatch repair protein MutL [Weizmannia acidilactici]